MTQRRTARPEPSPASDSIGERLATALVPQYRQTGAVGSTIDAIVTNLTASGTVTAAILAVNGGSSNFTLGSSTLKSMAFQHATAPVMSNVSITAGSATALVISGSSWVGGRVSSGLLSGGSATALVITGSSISTTPISGSSGSFTHFRATGTLTLGAFTSSTDVTILGYLDAVSATGLAIRLLVSSS